MRLQNLFGKRGHESSTTRYLELDFSALLAEDGAPRHARWSLDEVVLVDGETPTGLVVEHGPGASTGRSHEIRRVDPDYFGEA
jgi:restriction endonuclease Mrr